MSNEELCRLIQSGDSEAVLKLWRNTEHYITRAAKIFLNKRAGSFELEDLKQSGFIAMLRAARDYSPEKEAKFTTYLSYWLDAEFRLSDGITTRRRVKIKLDDGKTVETSAEPLRHAKSLDAPLSEDDERTEFDKLSETRLDPNDQYKGIEHKIWLEQLRDALSSALDQLPKEQRETIIARYYDGLKQEEVAAAAGISKTEVQKRETHALDQLRREKHKNGLEQFIDSQTNFYNYVSVNTFNTTHSSAVEKAVILRDSIRNSVKRRNKNE